MGFFIVTKLSTTLRESKDEQNVSCYLEVWFLVFNKKSIHKYLTERGVDRVVTSWSVTSRRSSSRVAPSLTSPKAFLLSLGEN